MTRHEPPVASTKVRAAFAGRDRDFQLRIGEIGELERICKAGIGAIMVRLASHQFYAHDIWETIRLGLEGGGAPETEATAIIMRYRSRPLADYIELATNIVVACVNGAPREAPGKSAGETSDGLASSPPSTESVPQSDLIPNPSGA